MGGGRKHTHNRQKYKHIRRERERQTERGRFCKCYWHLFDLAFSQVISVFSFCWTQSVNQMRERENPVSVQTLTVRGFVRERETWRMAQTDERNIHRERGRKRNRSTDIERGGRGRETTDRHKRERERKKPTDRH